MPFSEQAKEALKAPEKAIMIMFREAIYNELSFEGVSPPSSPAKPFISQEEREACNATPEGKAMLAFYDLVFLILSNIRNVGVFLPKHSEFKEKNPSDKSKSQEVIIAEYLEGAVQKILDFQHNDPAISAYFFQNPCAVNALVYLTQLNIGHNNIWHLRSILKQCLSALSLKTSLIEKIIFEYMSFRLDCCNPPLKAIVKPGNPIIIAFDALASENFTGNITKSKLIIDQLIPLGLYLAEDATEGALVLNIIRRSIQLELASMFIINWPYFSEPYFAPTQIPYIVDNLQVLSKAHLLPSNLSADVIPKETSLHAQYLIIQISKVLNGLSVFVLHHSLKTESNESLEGRVFNNYFVQLRIKNIELFVLMQDQIFSENCVSEFADFLLRSFSPNYSSVIDLQKFIISLLSTYGYIKKHQFLTTPFSKERLPQSFQENFFRILQALVKENMESEAKQFISFLFFYIKEQCLNSRELLVDAITFSNVPGNQRIIKLDHQFEHFCNNAPAVLQELDQKLQLVEFDEPALVHFFGFVADTVAKIASGSSTPTQEGIAHSAREEKHIATPLAKKQNKSQSPSETIALEAIDSKVKKLQTIMDSLAANVENHSKELPLPEVLHPPHILTTPKKATYQFYYALIQLRNISLEAHLNKPTPAVTSPIEHQSALEQKTPKQKPPKKSVKDVQKTAQKAKAIDKIAQEYGIHCRNKSLLEKSISGYLEEIDYANLKTAFLENMESRRIFMQLIYSCFLDGSHGLFFQKIMNSWIKPLLQLKDYLPPLEYDLLDIVENTIASLYLTENTLPRTPVSSNRIRETISQLQGCIVDTHKNKQEIWDTMKPLEGLDELSYFLRHWIQDIVLKDCLVCLLDNIPESNKLLRIIHILQKGAEYGYLPSCLKDKGEDVASLEPSSLPDYLLSQLQALYEHTEVIDINYGYVPHTTSADRLNSHSLNRTTLIILQFAIFDTKNFDDFISPKVKQELVNKAKFVIKNFHTQLLQTKANNLSRVLLVATKLFIGLEPVEACSTFGVTINDCDCLISLLLQGTSHFNAAATLLIYNQKAFFAEAQLQFDGFLNTLSLISQCFGQGEQECRSMPKDTVVPRANVSPSKNFFETFLMNMASLIDLEKDIDALVCFQKYFPLTLHALIEILQKTDVIHKNYTALPLNKRKHYEKKYLQLKIAIYHLAAQLEPDSLVLKKIATGFELDVNDYHDHQDTKHFGAVITDKKPKNKAKKEKKKDKDGSPGIPVESSNKEPPEFRESHKDKDKDKTVLSPTPVEDTAEPVSKAESKQPTSKEEHDETLSPAKKLPKPHGESVNLSVSSRQQNIKKEASHPEKYVRHSVKDVRQPEKDTRHLEKPLQRPIIAQPARKPSYVPDHKSILDFPAIAPPISSGSRKQSHSNQTATTVSESPAPVALLSAPVVTPGKAITTFSETATITTKTPTTTAAIITSAITATTTTTSKSIATATATAKTTTAGTVLPTAKAATSQTLTVTPISMFNSTTKSSASLQPVVSKPVPMPSSESKTEGLKVHVSFVQERPVGLSFEEMDPAIKLHWNRRIIWPRDDRKIIAKSSLPPVLLEFLKNSMPMMCIFLVDGTVFKLYSKDPSLRHFDLCVFGATDVQLLFEMLLKHVPKDSIAVKTNNNTTPMIHITLKAQDVSYEIKIELRNRREGETITAAIISRSLQTGFNTYSPYIDITDALAKKALVIEGNTELLMHEIRPLEDADNFFTLDPRRYTRVINAHLLIDLPFSEYLTRLLDNQAMTYYTLREFLDNSNPLSLLHAQELSNDFEEVLKTVNHIQVISIYNSKGIINAMTMLTPIHIDSTVALLGAFFSTNNPAGKAHLPSKKWAMLMAFFYEHYAASKRHCDYTNSLDPNGYWKHIVWVLQNCPFKNFISCVPTEYQVYFTYIKNKYLGFTDNKELKDRPFKEMVEKLDKYYKDIYSAQKSQTANLPNGGYPQRMPVIMQAMYSMYPTYYANHNPLPFFAHQQPPLPASMPPNTVYLNQGAPMMPYPGYTEEW